MTFNTFLCTTRSSTYRNRNAPAASKTPKQMPLETTSQNVTDSHFSRGQGIIAEHLRASPYVTRMPVLGMMACGCYHQLPNDSSTGRHNC